MRQEVDSLYEPVHLYAFGDIHVGSAHCHMKRLLRDLKVIENDPRGRWIFMGDGPEAITLTDKRFDMDDVHPEFQNPDALLNLPRAETEWLIEAMLPIKDKGLALLTGNHEETVADRTARQGTKYDPHYEMCQALDLPSLDFCGFLRWRFCQTKKGGRATRTITVFAHHGRGAGRRPGASANNLDDAMSFIDADLLLMGHDHKSFALPRVSLSVPRTGAPKVVERIQKGARTGTYLGVINNLGKAGYGEKANYQPLLLGMRKIIITPRDGKIEVLV